MKHLQLLHPFLFTLASILFLYFSSDVIASPDQILRPLLLLWFVLFLLIWPACQITGRNLSLASLLLTLFALGAFSTPSFFMIALEVSAVALLAGFVNSFRRKRKITVEKIGSLLSLISFLLVFVFISSLLSKLADIPISYYSRILNTDPPLQAELTEPKTKPDIYYIVLDGYARYDVLGDLYHFDNLKFVQALESKGLIVPEYNHSNYPKTALSVASTLNMDYIDSLTPGLQDSYFWWLMAPLIGHSQTRAMLERLDYRIITITSDWSITDNPSTEIYKPAPIVLNDFESFLLSHTPLRAITPLLENIAFVPSNEAHRELVRYSFDALAQISNLAGPKFVFAHITAPHPPFLLDSEGNALQPGYPFSFIDANDYPFTHEQYRSGYVGQVQYVNHQLENLVDTILQNSQTPPIIILQADHGPGMLTDFRSAENTCIRERFSNFAAYYLPDMQPGDIPQDITNVNIFRIIFNKYFSAKMPLLENSFYYYKDTIYIFRSVDVSSRVDTPCQVAH